MEFRKHRHLLMSLKMSQNNNIDIVKHLKYNVTNNFEVVEIVLYEYK